MTAETRYASRKWILAAVVVVACILLRAVNLLDQPLMVDLLKWTLGLYFGANVAQKGVEFVKEYFAVAQEKAP